MAGLTPRQNMTMSSIEPNSATRHIAEQPLPGDLAIWIFIAAELGVFAILFAAYAITRNTHLELFNIAQAQIDKTYGYINTIVLLTSSYCVARATRHIKEGNTALCTRFLSYAILLGALFLVVKIAEFQNDFLNGITLSSNLFDMFYISLTFFHFMHVIMGMIILSVVTYKSYTHKYNKTEHAGIETGGAYWHMVDLVWIILFSLVYVLH